MRRAADGGEALAVLWLALHTTDDVESLRLLHEAAGLGELRALGVLAVASLQAGESRTAADAFRQLEAADRSDLVDPLLYGMAIADTDGSTAGRLRCAELMESVGSSEAIVFAAAQLLGHDQLQAARLAERALMIALVDADLSVAAPAAVILSRARPGDNETELIATGRWLCLRGHHEVALAVADLVSGATLPDLQLRYRYLHALASAFRGGRLVGRRTPLEADRKASLIWTAHEQDLRRSQSSGERRTRQFDQHFKDISALGKRSNRALIYAAGMRKGERSVPFLRELVARGQPFHRELAETLVNLDRPDEAWDVARAGLKLGFEDARIPLAMLADDAAEAVELVRPICDFEWAAAVVGAERLCELDRFREARQMLHTAPRRACVVCALGWVYLAERQRARAVKKFIEAMERGCLHAPQNLIACNAIHGTRVSATTLELSATKLEAAGWMDLEIALLYARATFRHSGEPELATLLEGHADVDRLLDEWVFGEPPPVAYRVGSHLRTTGDGNAKAFDTLSKLAYGTLDAARLAAAH